MITGAAQMDGGILVVGELVYYVVLIFAMFEIIPLVMWDVDVAIERTAILCPVL